MEDALLKHAKTILSQNSRGNFTIPRAQLYPFQWNWDSGFVSLGLSNYNLISAFQEIWSLLSGQWENGMIPHIIFHSEKEKTYFPNWDFWETSINAGAPSIPKTSGISQPPVLGFVLEKMLFKHYDNEGVRQFAKQVFPKIVKYHEFWYRYRDPYKEGLVFIYHPWESGRDNSPIWDDALHLIDLQSVSLPSYTRKDTQITSAAERPTNQQYDQYVYLLELGKKYAYDQKGIAEESEFLIQDSLINALLIRSNEGLIKVGQTLDLDVGQLKEWQQQSKVSFDQKLWSSELANYTGYDLRQQKQLLQWEIGGLTALYAGIPSSEKAVEMKAYLDRLVQNDFLLVPSFDVFHPWFDSKRYWRGPIWPQMNWLVYQGLLRYGYVQMANQVRDDLLTLVSQFGFHEYFEAQRAVIQSANGGYGGNNFSWTASTIIDFLYDSDRL